MIGTKKLSTIRTEIERALAADGEDPIQRLERQIASAKRKGDRTDLIEGLRSFLETPRQGAKRNVRARPKKRLKQEK